VTEATIHELKIDPNRLEEIMRGSKRHEVRGAGSKKREYKVGDTLRLRAFDRKKQVYTSRLTFDVEVTNITQPGTYGLPRNIVVMSIAHPMGDFGVGF
jgi:ASC-1-like (ASCH) protein